MLMEEKELVEVVSAIRAVLDNSSLEHERQRCFEKIEEFKEGDPAKTVPIALKLLNETSDVSHIGWNIIEHIIRYKWNDMAPDIRLIIRNGVLQYMSEGRYSLTSENLPTKTFMSRNLVAIIEKEWPQNWPELFNQFKEIILNGTLHSQAQMIFIVLKRLIENVITKENVSNILRRKELSTAINMMMPEMFAVIIDRIQMCIEDGNNDNSILVAKFAIELLSESVGWADGRVLEGTVDRMVEVICAYLQVESHGINKSAATCLFKIASRKCANPDESSIVLSMFKDPPLQAIISAANLAAGVSASSADHYNHFKVLCDLLTALGIHLSEIWAYIKNPPPNFAFYLSGIYSLFTHPSIHIRSNVSQVLVVFGSHEHISRNIEFIHIAKRLIPHIPKNIEKIGSLCDTSSMTSYYARMDCENDSEFRNSFILLEDLNLQFMGETLNADHINQYLQQLSEWISKIILQNDSIAPDEWDGLKRFVMVFTSVAYQKELVTDDVDAKFVTMFTSIMNMLETVNNTKTANLMLSISSLFLQLFENDSELIKGYNERSKQIERIYSLSLQADESLADVSNEQSSPSKRAFIGSVKNQRAASTTDYRDPETSSPSDFDDYELPQPVTHPSDNIEENRTAADEPYSKFKFLMRESYYNVIGDIPSDDSNANSDLSTGESNYESDTSGDISSNSSCSEAAYPDNDTSKDFGDFTDCDSYSGKICRDFKNYWAEIVALKQDRKNIYRKLVKQLNKQKKYSGPESDEINVYIDLIEILLNMYIPVAGKIKAKFVHGNQDVIMKRGFKYERVPGTNNFECPYIFPGLFEFCCSSTIVLDDNDCLLPESTFEHEHPKAIFDPQNDDPVPQAKHVLLGRIASELPTNTGKKDYSKMHKWLKSLKIEVDAWLVRVQRCYNNGKIFKELLTKMEDFGVVPGTHILNYQNCISETRYLMQRIYIHSSLPNFREKRPES